MLPLNIFLWLVSKATGDEIALPKSPVLIWKVYYASFV